jgi:hypothetical protein
LCSAACIRSDQAVVMRNVAPAAGGTGTSGVP